jgi:hypothetical protein
VEKVFLKFIEKLAESPVAENTFNQYSYRFPENGIRRNNLLLYLQHLEKLKPGILLCGEAPSYRGARLTGIPFTSRVILGKGIEKFGLFGPDKGYRVSEEFPGVNSEPTATMIWQLMTELNLIPLGWNAYPFHPFKKGNPMSNRLPTIQEIKAGEIFLKELIGIFKIKTIIAVGNTAHFTLNNSGIENFKVRHPANGGKAEFVKGMKGLFFGTQN